MSFAATPVEAQESCHSMDHSKSKDAEASTIMQNYDDRSELHVLCCEESLTNSTTDQYIKVKITEVPRTWELFNHNKSSPNPNNFTYKDKDPPDIQVLNSSFLI
ncbi:MAG: hypothetical protein AAF462_05810 [Thermodesulfobacteriota bacterium]